MAAGVTETAGSMTSAGCARPRDGDVSITGVAAAAGLLISAVPVLDAITLIWPAPVASGASTAISPRCGPFRCD